jgi:DNA-directed RNA polymerase II subunit RPB1
MKERLNGKNGRMRANLMAKRVDFSARSVITSEPNISCMDVGVPKIIAMNLTVKERVNDLNKKELMMMIHNGPDVYPGAKILERRNGEKITLRYFTERNSITLEIGDIVHRHLKTGDIVLFNRQPSLHKMSMQGHRAVVLEYGKTFRLNVAVTKPYNADFDKQTLSKTGGVKNVFPPSRVNMHGKTPCCGKSLRA